MFKSFFFIICFIGGSIVATLTCQDHNVDTPFWKSPNAQVLQPKQENDPQENGRQEKDQKKKKIVIPADDDKAVERRDFMRIKMHSSQLVLEGMTTNNFSLIDKGIRQIKDLTKSEKWVSIDDKVYRQLVEDFEMATLKLEAAAKTKNIDATALRYFQLSTNCIDCHQLIREADYEF